MRKDVNEIPFDVEGKEFLARQLNFSHPQKEMPGKKFQIYI